MSHAYLFAYAAKSLQSYIMKGGKLRDMVGATSLIDKLSDEKTLRGWLTDGAFRLEDGVDFKIVQAAAGGARIQFLNKDAGEKVAKLWPLWCHAWAPDLEVVQHLEPWANGKYGEVSETVGQAMERARNFPAPRLPETGPFVKRAPRSGGPAFRKDPAAEKEVIDLASHRKRVERDDLKKSGQLPPVATAFGFTEPNQLPNDFEQVSGGERAYLAVVHADGNKLGEMFLRVGKALKETPADDSTAIELFRYLSQDVVADGTRTAAERAMAVIQDKIRRRVARQRELLEGKTFSDDAKRDKALEDADAWPFAPIVLAGDDLTIACRADLGLPFAEAFLLAFRAEMGERLKKLEAQDWWRSQVPEVVKDVIPKELSAGAGVVYCSDHYPFSLAYELCESLASQAKRAAKDLVRHDPKATPPSAISFVRITGGSAPTDFDGLEKGVLKGADGTLLTGCPYFIDGEARPHFSDLKAVYEAARRRPRPGDDAGDHKLGLPGSSLRDLVNRQRTDPESVPEAVERMLEVAKEKGVAPGFEAAWKKLSGHDAHTDWKDLRFFDAKLKERSPLLDLVTMLAIRDPDDDDQSESWASANPETSADSTSQS